MRPLRILLATACLVAAAAGMGQTQERQHEERERPSARAYVPGSAFDRAPAEFGRGPPVYGRGSAVDGRGPPPYGQQRYAPGPAYGAYGAPYRPPAPSPGGAWRAQQDFLRQGVRQGQLAPLGRVIAGIRQITPGRQLDSGIEYQGPRMVYRVRWITPEGRRVDYIVDAATGAILSGR